METKIFREINDEALDTAAQVIKDGGLVAFPTETVYGLGANALDAEASAKIYKAKGRPSDNPLIVHLAFPDEAGKYCEVKPLFNILAARFMPGPITVILPKKDNIPYTTTGGLDTVALRVPSNPVAHELILRSGLPIAAPSANISGKPSPTSFAHIEHDLIGRADVLLDGGDCTIGLESTIIRVDGDEKVTLLRPGGITVDMLTEVCDVEIDPAVLRKFDGKPQAPGMKYRHYAPDAPLVILDGDDEAVCRFLSDKKDCGILCFDEDAVLLARENALSYGAKNDSNAQAHRLFACLREFDKRNLSIIYARLPAKNGVGLAVFNRLSKAAGYEIINCKNTE